MAGSLNKVTAIGNLGADPEIRNMPGGGKVANFSVACTESWKDKQTGEKKERTEWLRCVCWNEGLIGVIDRYAVKGMKVYIEGSLQTRKWKDQDDNDRYSTEVVLTGFDAKFLMLGDAGGGGDRDSNDNAERPGNRAPADDKPGNGPGRRDDRRRASSQPAFEGGVDDDIPF